MSEETPGDSLVQVLFGLGRSLKHTGQFAEAGQVLLQGLEKLQSQGAETSAGLLAKGWHQLADVRQKEGDYQQANAIQQVIGDIEGQGLSTDNLRLLHMNMGKHELARQELESGLSIRQRLGDAWGTALSHVNLAHLALIQARFDDVARHAQAALAVAGNLNSAEIQVPAFWCLAMVHAERGELQAGVESARQALEMAQAARLMEGETDAQRILGILHTRVGKYSQAESALQCSYQLAVKQGGRYRQGLARYELGRLYQQQAQADRAAACFEEAVNLFAALGAIYDLGLAQAAVTST